MKIQTGTGDAHSVLRSFPPFMYSPVIRQNPRNVSFVNEDEYLLYNRDTRQVQRLNSAAALIYELFGKGQTLGAIRRTLESIQGNDGGNWNAAEKWIHQACIDRTLAQVNGEPDTELEQYGQATALSGEADRLREEGAVLAAYICQYRAASLDTQNPTYWHESGELAHILGRRQEARAAYQHYAEICPDDLEIKHLLTALADNEPPPRAPDDCVRQLYSRFAEFYEDNMCGDLAYQAPFRLQESISRHLQNASDLDILELGCGTGLAGKVLKPLAANLIGIDLSPEMVDKCRATGFYDELQVAEITAFLKQAKSGNRRYELVAACDTFIYFGDLKQVIEPAADLVTAGGSIVFTVEEGTTRPYKLTDSGRFAHTGDYIMSVAQEAGLELISLDQGFLRYEYGDPVSGLVVLLRKQG